MKKNHFFKSILAGLLLSFALILPALNLLAEDPPKEDPIHEILRGYTPGQAKVVTGYHIEHFGFLGGEFSKIIREYEYIRCCKKTNSMMDGCSVGVVCP